MVSEKRNIIFMATCVKWRVRSTRTIIYSTSPSTHTHARTHARTHALCLTLISTRNLFHFSQFSLLPFTRKHHAHSLFYTHTPPLAHTHARTHVEQCLMMNAREWLRFAKWMLEHKVEYIYDVAKAELRSNNNLCVCERER